MDEELVEVIVNIVLSVLSLGAIYLCRHFPLACVAFFLYLLAEVAVVVQYYRIQQVRNQRYQSANDIRRRSTHIMVQKNKVIHWTRPSYFPFLAAQALLFAGVEMPLCLFPLAPPALYLLLTEVLGKQVDPVVEDLSALLSAVCVGYAGFSTHKIFGDICALVNLAAFCRLGPEKFRNSMEHLMLVALGQLIAIQFFTDFVHEKNSDPFGFFKYFLRH